MEKFNVIISDQFWAEFFDSLDYIKKELENHQAAKAIWEDALKTIKSLETFPKACAVIEGRNGEEYRKTHLKKHRYKIIFEIHNHDVIIEGFLHDSQDYENLL